MVSAASVCEHVIACYFCGGDSGIVLPNVGPRVLTSGLRPTDTSPTPALRISAAHDERKSLQEVWDRHFIAFSAQDVSTLNIYQGYSVYHCFITGVLAPGRTGSGYHAPTVHPPPPPEDSKNNVLPVIFFLRGLFGCWWRVAWPCINTEHY